ncbi:MAG TPA: hypothetical protein VFB60_01550 [Ktedonobacteraceae bacterium]|nr:hypothetical protein [Ktedonobacteraceae bacterium]
MKVLTRRGNAQHNRMKGMLILVAIFLVVGAGVWILNIYGILQGPWSNIFGVISTILGLILGLLRWYAQSVSVMTPAPISPIQKKHVQLIDGSTLNPPKNRATLIVYAGKHLRGTTINLSYGFDTLHLKTYAATNIVERRICGQTAFVGIFPSLEPGNYIAHDDSRKLMSKVTVISGHIAEIDWRHSKLST